MLDTQMLTLNADGTVSGAASPVRGRRRTPDTAMIISRVEMNDVTYKGYLLPSAEGKF